MLDLSISISFAHIECLKKSLNTFLPDIPSCHRLEGASRGLGFRNYNALRTAAVTNDAVAIPNGEAFASYLSELGISVEPEKIFHVVASVAIAGVMEELPRLTSYGMGIGQIRRSQDGSWEDHVEKFKNGRQELLTEKFAEEFLVSLAFVRKVRAIKTINASTGSYGLKHIAEKFQCRYPTGRPLGFGYVSNGAFIAAAVHAGFKYRNRYDALNVHFNMSERCIADLDCEIRPNGARAQDRARREQMRELARRYHLPIKSVSNWHNV